MQVLMQVVDAGSINIDQDRMSSFVSHPINSFTGSCFVYELVT